jgi:hypothetical protein
MLKDYSPFQANDFEYLRGRILILLPENDIFKKRRSETVRRSVPETGCRDPHGSGRSCGFIVQAERYLDLMETFLQRNGI